MRTRFLYQLRPILTYIEIILFAIPISNFRIWEFQVISEVPLEVAINGNTFFFLTHVHYLYRNLKHKGHYILQYSKANLRLSDITRMSKITFPLLVLKC